MNRNADPYEVLEVESETQVNAVFNRCDELACQILVLKVRGAILLSHKQEFRYAKSPHRD